MQERNIECDIRSYTKLMEWVSSMVKKMFYVKYFCMVTMNHLQMKRQEEANQFMSRFHIPSLATQPAHMDLSAHPARATLSNKAFLESEMYKRSVENRIRYHAANKEYEMRHGLVPSKSSRYLDLPSYNDPLIGHNQQMEQPVHHVENKPFVFNRHFTFSNQRTSPTSSAIPMTDREPVSPHSGKKRRSMRKYLRMLKKSLRRSLRK